MAINKQVQELAKSTVHSYGDVLALYEHYKDIEDDRKRNIKS